MNSIYLYHTSDTDITGNINVLFAFCKNIVFTNTNYNLKQIKLGIVILKRRFLFCWNLLWCNLFCFCLFLLYESFNLSFYEEYDGNKYCFLKLGKSILSVKYCQ